MEFAASLWAGFWSKDIWLPPNITWADIEPNERVQYTNYRHLWLAFPMALVVLLFRILLERYVFCPFGVVLGFRLLKQKKAQPNELLERMFKQKTKPNHREISGAAKQLDMSERQVERWLRLRRSQEKPTTLQKFCECSWRCTYYALAFVYGLYTLWDKEWLWDINQCWTNYPHQGVTNDTWWYYMISVSFYWSLAISQFTDVKRKDFWQMFVHHIAAICLLSFSWVCNLHRVGTLVLLVHDCGDIFLEAAKMAKYAKYQRVCDTIFAVFTVVWIVTRLGIYPGWIIYSTSVDAPRIVNTMFPAYYIFNGLLFLLLALHIFWTTLILKIVYNSICAGQMERDIRSSSSEEVTDTSTNSNSNSRQKSQ